MPADLFPDAPVHVSLDRQIRAAAREVAFRKIVYARRVAEGKMRQEQADEEIAVMAAIVTTLKGLADDAR